MDRSLRNATALLLALAGFLVASGQACRLVTTRVEINNVSATFLIDTGADCSIIDSAFAHRLGLKPSGIASVQRNFSAGDSIVVTAGSVRFGPRLWSEVPLVTQDLGVLSRINKVSLQGALGTDLLAKTKVLLSYSSGTARVVRRVDRSAFMVALTKVRNRYFVPTKIGSTTFDLLLDSGTNMSAISESVWQQLPSSLNSNQLVAGVQSSGSPSAAFIGCLPAFHIRNNRSEISLRDIPIRVVAPPPFGIFADAAFAGILGGDILERFDVWLDLSQSSIYLKPARGFQFDPYEFSTIGIQFLKLRSDSFTVMAVWKPSPAESAGVVTGDRILSVNGHSSSELGIETFASQLHGPAGTPVVIEVERAGVKVTLQMKIQQLVCSPSVASHSLARIFETICSGNPIVATNAGFL